MLAHERAHLTHHHHRYRTLAEVAAAVNPLLARVRDQIGFQLERWADEDAANAVGNRRLTARSLAHAALATTGTTVLGFAEHEVPARARALPSGPITGRPVATLPTVAVLAAGASALTNATYAFIRVLTALIS